MYVLICTEPTITGFPSESRGNEGEEVVIKPKVGGHPPPSLTWYHDGREVTADYATELNQDGGLSFPSVETKHAGEYRLHTRSYWCKLTTAGTTLYCKVSY